jgi:hypothetical protein
MVGKLAKPFLDLARSDFWTTFKMPKSCGTALRAFAL